MPSARHWSARLALALLTLIALVLVAGSALAQLEEPPPASGLVDAVVARDWYAIAAGLVWVLVYASRRMGWLERVPEGWRWTVPLGLGVAAAFVGAWQRGLPWDEALRLTVEQGLTISLLAMGAHGALRDMPIGYGGGAGGGSSDTGAGDPPVSRPGSSGGSASALLGGLVLLVGVGGCTASQVECETAWKAAQVDYLSTVLTECDRGEIDDCPAEASAYAELEAAAETAKECR